MAQNFESSKSISSSSDVASVSWLDANNGAQETRVYYQDDSGNILEKLCTNGKWGPGNGGQPLIKAKPGTRISADYWYQEGFGGNQIRLYYISENGGIKEYCYVGDHWTSGVTVV